MARNLRTLNQINNFISQVSVQAAHHAPNVVSVIHSLSTEVINRLTLGVDKIEVYERNGKLARTCWVTINGIRKVFTYNYTTQQIDLKDGGLQGNTIFNFDNATTVAQIKRIIQNW